MSGTDAVADLPAEESGTAHKRQLLQALAADLREVIGLEVTSPMAKMLVAMADDILTLTTDDAIARAPIDAGYISERRRTLTELISVGRSLQSIEERTIAQAEAALEQTVAAPARASTMTTLDSALETLFAAVSAAIQEEQFARLKSLQARMIEATGRHAQQLSDLRAANANRIAASRLESRAPVTVEALQDYWRRRYPDRPKAVVTSLRELSGGFSKTTMLFIVENWEQQPASLVLRRDLCGGATDKSVVDEYHVIETAFARGIVAPEPVLLERDPQALARPFMVTRRVEGTPAGDLWKTSPESTVETALDLARTLGRLHGMRPQDFGEVADADPHSHVTVYLRELEQSWLKRRPGPEPCMLASLDWLKRNLPVPRRLSFVHGDPGAWNLLTKGGRLAGLLDWELWHFGDAMEDVSYVKGFVESLMPWNDFLAAYREAGGVEYEPEAGTYYDIFRDVRNAIFSVFAGNAFRTHRNPEMRMAHCEEKSYPMLLLRGANLIAAKCRR